MRKLILAILIFFCGCSSVPKGILPVTGFEISRYLGTWYEIARLDHSFERGLINISAEYSQMDDGGVKVLNRGFDPVKNKWKEVEGRAYFVSDPSTGSLKVSFFRPFYGGYHIIALDKEQYEYALVCGPDRSYLWILSKKPFLDEKIKADLILKAKQLGFDVGSLIQVRQDSK